MNEETLKHAVFAAPLERKSYVQAIESTHSSGRFTGYASVFYACDSHADVVLPGAFARAISHKALNKDIKLLWQHRQDEPIGVFDWIEEDTHGLYIKGRLLLGIQRADEAYLLMKSNTIQGLSIGYRPVDYFYDDQTQVRYLREVDLCEISLVTFPANEHANITSLKHQGG